MTALHFIQHHLLALSCQVKALMPSTHVVSDGLASFVEVKSAACSHEPIIHNSGTAKANVQDARFKAINTLLGNLTMWMNTTFRGFKTGHYAMRYMAEFQYRFNRRFDLAKQISIRNVASNVVHLLPAA